RGQGLVRRAWRSDLPRRPPAKISGAVPHRQAVRENEAGASRPERRHLSAGISRPRPAIHRRWHPPRPAQTLPMAERPQPGKHAARQLARDRRRRSDRTAGLPRRFVGRAIRLHAHDPERDPNASEFIVLAKDSVDVEQELAAISYGNIHDTWKRTMGAL